MKKLLRSNQRKKVKFSISMKIVSYVILVTLISMGGITGLITYLLNDIVGQESKNYTQTMVESNLNDFQQKFSNIESAVSVIVSDIVSEVDVSLAKEDPEYLVDYKRKLASRLKQFGESTDLTKSVYTYFNTNLFSQEIDVWMLENEQGEFELQDSFGMEYYQEYNEWYSEPIDNQNTMWTFPYVSVDNSNIVASYVTPVIVNGETIGMVGMDLYLDEIAESINTIEVYETGYLYLMHPDGRVIAHPRVEFGTSLLDVGDFQFLLDEFNANITGYTSYERDDGTAVFSAYGKMDNGWIVGSSIPEVEVLQSVRKISKISLEITFAVVFISLLISIYIGRSITKPIKKIVDSIEQIKDGDFTTLVTVNSNDETEVLGQGLNSMSENIRGLIKDVKFVSMNIMDSASTLAAMSEETNATVDQVASNMRNIDCGTQDTAKDAENGAVIASQIERQFIKLMENSNMMKENAIFAIEMNQLGQETISLLREKSKESQESNRRVTNAVNNLDGQTKEITNIIGTITSIAVQTNLLALNASIEATRAGDAGRGFAVVAEEIRKLAENSTESVNEISEIVTNIQKESKDTVHIMNEVSALSEDQNDVVEKAHEAFGKIFNSVEGITKQIEIVATELNSLNESKSELVESITNISAVAEETSAATEQVRHSMEDQTKAVEQVAANAEQLNELSSDLNRTIEAFKI